MSPPAAGSVALAVVGAPLSEPGLRVLMEPADGTVRVVVTGLGAGTDGVEVCPVVGVAGPPEAAACVVVGPGGVVDLALREGADGGPAGVLLRPAAGPSGAPVRVPEVTFTYRPGGDSLTVVTPPLPPSETPGDCPGGACEMTFSVTPTARGSFRLEADGRDGRPQLTLRSGSEAGRSSRVVSIVEGGSRLRIRATVEGPVGASLTLRNLGSTELPPLELALVWPTRR